MSRLQGISAHSWLFAATLVLSASLLFVVQPMFSKMILPMLGGAPQVWNTAVLFFQATLLAGYAYAHATSAFLSIRIQALIQLALLVAFFFGLPFLVTEDSGPAATDNPYVWQLTTMALAVGGPFFVLAASAPMLQRWYASLPSKNGKSTDPYYLYAASNLGSMLALLSYPVLVETTLNVPEQTKLWSYGYALLACATLACALSVILINTKGKKTEPTKLPRSAALRWSQRMNWILLSFIPSSLMLGVTTAITSDIAAVPLLWIVPLTLYVATFIIVFASKPLVNKAQMTTAFGVLCTLMIAHTIVGCGAPCTTLTIGLNLALFTSAALTCHLYLAQSRPPADRLTEFYLLISLGGVLGGFFNAIIAPVFFYIPIEYTLIMALATFVRYWDNPEHKLAVRWPPFKKFAMGKPGTQKLRNTILIVAGGCLVGAIAFFNYSLSALDMLATAGVAAALAALMSERWSFAVLAAVLLLAFPQGYRWNDPTYNRVLFQGRNFFSPVMIADTNYGQRLLKHGVTKHGAQSTLTGEQFLPLSYYGSGSPLADAIGNVPHNAQNVAVLGLGVGVVACLVRKNMNIDFYEIDPLIVSLAENEEYFTFLSGCSIPYKIKLGDARLTVKDAPDNRYDMIIVDVFNSDNIPVHLLTAEAFAIYKSKLRDNDSLLVIHISNRYLDLEPLIAAAAEHLGFKAYAKINLGGDMGGDRKYDSSHWAVLFSNDRYEKAFLNDGWTPAQKLNNVKLWTDQFSNILGVFGNKTGAERTYEAHQKLKKNH